MSQTEAKTPSRRTYCRPEITVVRLDNHISLVMMTPGPPNPPPRGKKPPHTVNPQGKGSSYESPFASPFGDKTFD